MVVLILVVLWCPLVFGQECGTPRFHEEAIRLHAAWGKGSEAWARAGVPLSAQEYEVGDTKVFYTSIGSRWLPATLRVKGTHCYLWAEDALWGQTITPQKLAVLRAIFDDSTKADPTKGAYELVTDAFGPPPDIDNDHRIHILVLNIGEAGVGGYFRPANEYPQSVEPTSNELDMFYYDDDLNPQTSAFASVVPAHELQHMINWNMDPDEQLWINEGCSGLAELLVGYLNAGGWASTWAQNTDKPLTNWQASEGDYFGTALFAIYLYDRFGGNLFTRTLLAQQANGIPGITNALAALGISLSFAQVYQNWSLANLLDNPSPDYYGGAYGYACINLPVSVGFAQDHSSYPVPPTTESVGGWGTDYIRLRDGALLQWAATGPYDQWRRIDVTQVRSPMGGGLPQVIPRGSVVDTMRVSLDGFGADWDPQVMVVCNTSPSEVYVSYREFTLPHPASPRPLPGWPVVASGELSSSPTVAGNLMVLASKEGTIWLGDSSGQPLEGWPIQVGAQVWASPVLADLDGDATPEVAVGTKSSPAIHVWALDGSPKPGWPVSVAPSTYGIPGHVVAADLDGDGKRELLAASFSGHLYCFRHDGTPQPGWPVSVGAPLYSPPAVGDLNGDGLLDVCVVSTDKKVHLFSATGQEQPGWPVSVPGRSWAGVALASLGRPAAVVADETGTISALDGTGNPLPGWPQSLGERVQAPCAVGDLTGDGSPEVIVATLSGKVSAFTRTGELVAGWPRITGGQVWSSPVVADVDGDGAFEVAVCPQQGKVVVFEGDGSCTPGWPQLVGQSTQAGPAVGDLDGDGTTELMVLGMQGLVQVWALGTPFNELNPWPQAGRDPTHSSSLLTPAGGGVVPLPAWFALHVFPQPASSWVAVKPVGPEGPVRLEVFDLRGGRLAVARAPGVISVSGLAKGTYVLVATDEGGRTARAAVVVD